MEPTHLTCMDEDLTIEITRTKDEDHDLIIAVSLTRTYVLTGPRMAADNNGRAAKDLETSSTFTL